MLNDDSKLQSGIKRLERNSAVLGQFVFWSRFLRQQQQGLFGKPYRALEFGEPVVQDLRSGLDDNSWVRDEDSDEGEILGQADGMFDDEAMKDENSASR